MFGKLFTQSAIVGVVSLGANVALAIEYGYTAFECIEIFEAEASGEGSSCNIIGRKKNAESRAIDALERNADEACGSVYVDDDELWTDYCQLVCENNGYEETSGAFTSCSYDVTDTDVWTEEGCLTGDEQHNRQEADVECGCSCTTRL